MSVEDVIAIDVGGDTLKAGRVNQEAPAFVIPNCTATLKFTQKFVADQIDRVPNQKGFNYKRSVERGYLVHTATQAEILNRLFEPKNAGGLGICDDVPHRFVAMTEPPVGIPALQSELDEMMFETMQVDNFFRAPAVLFAALADSVGPAAAGSSATPQPEVRMVVDSGYSFSHAVPVITPNPGASDQGSERGPTFGNTLPKAIGKAIRRVDIGGKLLTNCLKDFISYRKFDMSEELALIEGIKRQCCYCAPRDARSVLNSPEAVSNMKVTYVLPDYKTVKRGYLFEPPTPFVSLKAEPSADGSSQGGENSAASADSAQQPLELPPNAQTLQLASERVSVPEVIFHPHDVGIDQGGIHHAVWQSINSLSKRLAPVADALYANIVLTGGNTLFDGFSDRFESELEALAPEGQDVQVRQLDDPIHGTWKGLRSWIVDPDTDFLASYTVTRQEYEEHGARICNERYGPARYFI